MREIVVLSGKGGTGKTSLTAAFAHLASDAVLADLDVDAPDLHILLDPKPRFTNDFVSGHQAVIAPDRCSGCGTCAELCRFGAVRQQGGVFSIDPQRCEGCKVCVALCPERAIDFPDKTCGQWSISDTRFGTMVHAQLHPGEENSGRLVTLLKNEAKALAKAQNARLVLCDGAPGIGCPVISSLSGAHLAAVVTEPTPSGRHDFERVATLCDHFRIPVAVMINKCDLNIEESERITAICRDKGYEVVAHIPHDGRFTEAMISRRALTESKRLADTPTVQAIRQAYARLKTLACRDATHQAR